MARGFFPAGFTLLTCSNARGTELRSARRQSEPDWVFLLTFSATARFMSSSLFLDVTKTTYAFRWMILGLGLRSASGASMLKSFCVFLEVKSTPWIQEWLPVMELKWRPAGSGSSPRAVRSSAVILSAVVRSSAARLLDAIWVSELVVSSGGSNQSGAMLSSTPRSRWMWLPQDSMYSLAAGSVASTARNIADNSPTLNLLPGGRRGRARTRAR